MNPDTCVQHVPLGTVTAATRELNSRAALDAAAEIAAWIIQKGETGPDGSLTWGRGYGRQLEPVADAGIFNGRLGEALFLSASFRAWGDPELKRAALSAITPLRARIADKATRNQLIEEVSLGLTGAGSMIYGLVRMSQFLEMEELWDTALLLGTGITRTAASRDTKYEVFWGAAGAALGLLALADCGVEPALAMAVVCADHLVASRAVDESTGCRAWAPRGDGRCMTGFAHGSSGIAYALLQIHARAADRRYYDSAIEAFAFERQCYRSTTGEWLDHVGQVGKVMSSWCHGSVGVGFARLAAVPVVERNDEALVATDLLNVITALARNHSEDQHMLCCGNFGRVDFLYEAAKVLGNPTLETLALQKAAHALDQVFRKEWKTAAYVDAGAHVQPGLWQGLPGIGYELLRLTDRSYPSVLTLS